MRQIGILMNGVTGRMGTNQHLLRSLKAIRDEGGLPLANGEVVMPEPVLLGRNPDKLASISEKAGGLRWTTDLDAELANPEIEIYFDAQTTDRRFEAVKKAIAAGKHVYCEKPTGTSLQTAYELYRLAVDAGVKHGVVQDKLWLPGLLKLKALIDAGFFGRILSVRGEFGYWVFTGEHGEPLQRPSWNYRKEDGGGIIVDMLCHWRYVLDNLFGEVRSLSCLGATHVPERWDESSQRYDATADDSAYATFQLASGVIAQFNSSWTVRVRRDDLLTLQVDGTEGSAVAGLRECRFQSSSATPRAVWNPDIPQPIDFWAGWETVPDAEPPHQAGSPGAPSAPGVDPLFATPPQNAFRAEWELFLRHVVEDAPFRWDLREGAKGVQLAELGIESWQKRSWVNVPELPIYER